MPDLPDEKAKLNPDPKQSERLNELMGEDPTELHDQSYPVGNENTASLSAAPVAKRSRMIGPNKLLQRIGTGGMGEVWMADQETPVRRRVALKLIKSGEAAIDNISSEEICETKSRIGNIARIDWVAAGCRHVCLKSIRHFRDHGEQSSIKIGTASRRGESV